ncbi:tetratricopeptide repeat protein [Schinkia azotoformans]|uniref:tetratricopeptide repeat protein n=1 Tax=Schinkia azotoformans TaxID=1454 RepID=UPI002E1FB124|nr:tetratricopeptide repeat protein [Schinkia azotoformans]
MELDDKIYDKIVELCEEGDNLTEEDRFHDAIDKYNAALDLVPSPKRDWEAGTWIYTALGDAYFIIENYKKAKECFFDALNCPDGVNNPLILLRLGESLFECGEHNKAEEYLLKAYMLEGYNIFKDEDEKYFGLIKERI